MSKFKPQLRVVGTRGNYASRFKDDISSLLASVVKTEPTLSPQEAMWEVQKQMLNNNPYQPPKDGKCIINSLPAKILAHIFRAGVELQKDGGDDWIEEIDSDGDEEDEAESSKSLLKDDLIEDEDDEDDEDWEDDESEEEEIEEEEEIPFEILVSQVCKFWRETAINTPDLWTTIYIDEPYQWSRYELYLERAKTEALDLEIDLEGEEESTDEPNATTSQQGVKRLMDLIAPKASQWHSLLISTDRWRDAREILEQLHQVPGAPLLEAFQFHCYDAIEDYEEFEPAELKEPFYLPFHGAAPKLEAVKLLSVHIDWDGAISMFKNLNELDLGYHAQDVLPSWETFSTYLKNSPKLAILGLKSSGPRLPDPSSVSQLPLLEAPSLQSLSLCDHKPVYALALAKKLHFPKLQFLSLDYEGEDFTEVAETYSKPVEGVSGSKSLFETIDTFELNCLGHVRDEAIAPVLHALKNLTHLSLDCGEEVSLHGTVSKIWKALGANAKTIYESSKSNKVKDAKDVTAAVAALNLDPSVAHPDLMLPLLEGIRTRDVPGAELRRFLDRRIKIGVPLKLLSVHPNDQIEEEDEKWFRGHLDDFDYYFDSDEEDEDEDEEEEDEDKGGEDNVVQAGNHRGPTAHRRIRGAASSRVTTGLSNLD